MLDPVSTPWIALGILSAYVLLRHLAGRWGSLDAVGFPDAYLQAGRQTPFPWGMSSLTLLFCGLAWPLLAGELAYANGHARMHWMIGLGGLCMMFLARIGIRFRRQTGVHESLCSYLASVHGQTAGTGFLLLQGVTTALTAGLTLRLGGALLGAWFDLPPRGLVILLAGVAWVGIAGRGASKSMMWHGGIGLALLLLFGWGVYETLLYPRSGGSGFWNVLVSGSADGLARESALDMFFSGLGRQAPPQDASALSLAETAFVFGIPFSVAFAGGVFALPAVWQCLCAMQRRHLRTGLSLTPLPVVGFLLAMGVLGTVAAGSGGRIEPAWQTAPLVLQTLLPASRLLWMGVAFWLLTQATLDAHVEAFAGSVALHTLFRKGFVRDRLAERHVRHSAALLLLVAAGCAWGIGLQPLPWMYLTGTLGATACFPVLVTLYGGRRSGWHVVVSGVCGVAAGLPVLLYGLLAGGEEWVAWGALFAWGVPGLVLLPRSGRVEPHPLAEELSTASAPDSKTTEIDPRLKGG